MNVAGEIVVDIGFGGKCDLDCDANADSTIAKLQPPKKCRHHAIPRIIIELHWKNPHG